MRKYILFLFCLFIAFSGISAEESLFAPGVVAIWADGGGTPVPGVSLKRYSVGGSGAFSLSSFELKAGYNTESEAFRFDAVWPMLYGFLAPGVSIDTGPDGTVPWFLAELDLFYFPSLFAAVVFFEKPRVVPSPFFNIRLGPEGSGFDIGLRLSVPLYPRSGSKRNEEVQNGAE